MPVRSGKEAVVVTTAQTPCRTATSSRGRNTQRSLFPERAETGSGDVASAVLRQPQLRKRVPGKGSGPAAMSGIGQHQRPIGFTGAFDSDLPDGTARTVLVTFMRRSKSSSWGFAVGETATQDVVISSVVRGSPAYGSLQRFDKILQVWSVPVARSLKQVIGCVAADSRITLFYSSSWPTLYILVHAVYIDGQRQRFRGYH